MEKKYYIVTCEYKSQSTFYEWTPNAEVFDNDIMAQNYYDFCAKSPNHRHIRIFERRMH